MNIKAINDITMINPHIVHLPEIIKMLHVMGHKIKTLPMAEWIAGLENSKLKEDRFAVSVRNYYLDASGVASGQMSEARPPIFDTTNTLYGLQGTKIRCEELKPEYLARLVSRLSF